MRRISERILVVSLCGLFGLALLLPRLPARAGRGGGSSGQNGDTNGDGGIDISDAIYLLLFLFQDGQPPVACADSPELIERIASLESRFASMERAFAGMEKDISTLKGSFPTTGSFYGVAYTSGGYSPANEYH